MFKRMTLILFSISLIFAGNPINRGSLKIDGSATITKDHSSRRTYWQFYGNPQIEYFVSKNIGIGLRPTFQYYLDDDRDFLIASITPLITWVSERPEWPIYLSVGSSLNRRIDEEDELDYARYGWLAELGVEMFLTDNFVVTPNLSYRDNADYYQSQIASLNVRVGYYFHGTKIFK